MVIRDSSAQWEGSLVDGKGTMRLGSGAYEGAYSRASRFEQAPGTNPEELIGAAHAGCFSMALAAIGPSEPQTFAAWSSVRNAVGDAAAELFNATDQAQIEEILQRLTETANDLVAEIQ